MSQNTNDLLSPILESPEAISLSKQLQERLKKEQILRKEFYDQITEQEKAEFINGKIILHSPVMLEHSEIRLNVSKILDTYALEYDLGWVGDEKVLIQLDRNDYEPDVCFFGKEKANRFVPNQKLFPAPDLVVEVLSPSTAPRDRGIKFDDYRLHGIGEYWIISPSKKVLEQYILEDKQYILHQKSAQGDLTCKTLNGLVFPIPVIFDKKKTHRFLKNLS